MSLEWNSEDEFKINSIVTATADKKGVISINGDGTFDYVYADEDIPSERHILTNLEYDELEKLPHIDRNTLEIMKQL